MHPELQHDLGTEEKWSEVVDELVGGGGMGKLGLILDVENQSDRVTLCQGLKKNRRPSSSGKTTKKQQE